MAVYYKEKLEKNVVLVFKFEHIGGSATALDVRAFLEKSSGKNKKMGFAFFSMHGKKRVEILDICVKQSFRHRGIASRMLKLAIDFLQDGTFIEIWGNITSANVLKKAIKFYTKNGFTINERISTYGKNTFAKLTLTKPELSQFFNLHEVERITKAEYDAY